MYTPKDFEETRIDRLHQLMKSHPLATLVTLGDAELIVNHLPFLIDPSCGLFGSLKNYNRLDSMRKRLPYRIGPRHMTAQRPE